MGRGRWTVVGLGVVTALGVIGVMTGGLRRAAAMKAPCSTPAASDEWRLRLAEVDRALEASDIGRALAAWRDAYGVALGTRRWEPMFAMGEAALRIGRAAGATKGYDEKARQCYLTALFRARHEQSIDGAFAVAEAFADLGDLEVARRALRVGEALTHRAGDNPRALAHAAALRTRLHRGWAPSRDVDVDLSASPAARPEAPTAASRRRALGEAP